MVWLCVSECVSNVRFHSTRILECWTFPILWTQTSKLPKQNSRHDRSWNDQGSELPSSHANDHTVSSWCLVLFFRGCKSLEISWCSVLYVALGAPHLLGHYRSSRSDHYKTRICLPRYVLVHRATSTRKRNISQGNLDVLCRIQHSGLHHVLQLLPVDMNW